MHSLSLCIQRISELGRVARSVEGRAAPPGRLCFLWPLGGAALMFPRLQHEGRASGRRGKISARRGQQGQKATYNYPTIACTRSSTQSLLYIIWPGRV